MFVIEQVAFGEHVQHEIGRSIEIPIARVGIAQLERPVVDLQDDARKESSTVRQLDRRMDATVQAGREQSVIVDAHCDVGQQSGLTHIEFTDHGSASYGPLLPRWKPELFAGPLSPSPPTPLPPQAGGGEGRGFETAYHGRRLGISGSTPSRHADASSAPGMFHFKLRVVDRSDRKLARSSGLRATTNHSEE